MNYGILLSKAAERDLRKLDKHIQRESIKALADIAENPYQAGKKLTGFASEYWSYHFSVQGTEYRIAYEIRDDEVIVFVLQIGPRENFYKTLKRRI